MVAHFNGNRYDGMMVWHHYGQDHGIPQRAEPSVLARTLRRSIRFPAVIQLAELLNGNDSQLQATAGRLRWRAQLQWTAAQAQLCLRIQRPEQARPS